MDLRDVQLGKADLDALTARYPAVSFAFSFQFYGKTITTEETELDLHGKKLSTLQAVRRLRGLPAQRGKAGSAQHRPEHGAV